MATLLLGTAAVAGGEAATTGLIGAGGAFGGLAGGAVGAQGLAALALTTGTTLGVTGALQQGAMAAAQAEAQSRLAEYNARVAEQQAESERLRTQFAQRRQSQEAQRIQSAMRAGFGMSGAVTTEGAPLMIQARQVAESELENLLLGYEGQIRQQRALSEAGLERMRSRMYAGQAGGYRTAGYIGAGRKILTGFLPFTEHNASNSFRLGIS